MRYRTAAITFLSVLALAVTAQAHEGHRHQIMGTVTSIDTAQVTVKTREGESISVPVTTGTKYHKGDKPTAASDVNVNDRVVIEATEKEGKLTASDIHLAPSGEVGGHEGHEERPHEENH